jgi:PPOX class probable F420-dependent enzyme
MPVLGRDTARELLAAARVARLATVSPDGRPHIVPVAFAVEGDRIYSAVDAKPKTTRDLRRLANIRAHPGVAVLADHYAEDWTALWWARADGDASVLDDASAMARPVRLLAERYPLYRAAPPAGPVISILVRRWTGWSAATGWPPLG